MKMCQLFRMLHLARRDIFKLIVYLCYSCKRFDLLNTASTKCFERNWGTKYSVHSLLFAVHNGKVSNHVGLDGLFLTGEIASRWHVRSMRLKSRYAENKKSPNRRVVEQTLNDSHNHDFV